MKMTAGILFSIQPIAKKNLTFACCREYLTGFHKRKVARTEAARAKAKEKEKAHRLEARRQVSCLSLSYIFFYFLIGDIVFSGGMHCANKQLKIVRS
jgi:hypothetical protein